MKNSMTIRDRLIMLFVSLYMMHSSSFIAFHTPAIIWAGIEIVVFVLLFSACFKSISLFKYIFPVIAIPIAQGLFKNDLSNTTVFFQFIAQIMQWCTLPMLTCFIFIRGNKQIALYVLAIYCLVQLSTGISTIIACQIDPSLARMDYGTLREEAPEFYAYRMNLNVGDYHTSYGYTAMIPIVIMLIKNRSLLPSPTKILIITSCTLGIMFSTIFSAQYTMSFMASLALMSLFLCPKHISKNYFYLSLVVAIILVIVLKYLLPPLLYIISDFTNSDIMSARLTDLADTIESGRNQADADSDFNIRMLKYKKSINNITLFGGWTDDVSGGHSFIFDNLARMGIIGFLLLFVQCRTIIKRYINIFKGQPWFYYYYYGLLVIFIFYFVNPDGMYDQLLFVYPVSGYLMKSYSKNMNEL